MAFTPSPLQELKWFKICFRVDTGQIHEMLLPQIQRDITDRFSHQTATKGFCLRFSGGITEPYVYNQHVQWSGSTTETADPVTKPNQLQFQSCAHFLKWEKLISFKLKSSFFHITVAEIHIFAWLTTKLPLEHPRKSLTHPPVQALKASKIPIDPTLTPLNS